MTVVHECGIRVSFAIFDEGCPPCGRCGGPIPGGSYGLLVEDKSCGHAWGYCESCGMFQCMLSDAEMGDDMAAEFVAWLAARRAEMN